MTACDRCGESTPEPRDTLPGEQVYCGQCWEILTEDSDR